MLHRIRVSVGTTGATHTRGCNSADDGWWGRRSQRWTGRWSGCAGQLEEPGGVGGGGTSTQKPGEAVCIGRRGWGGAGGWDRSGCAQGAPGRDTPHLMPVEQGLPWHPVATGLAGQAIPFVVAASHAHSLPTGSLAWLPLLPCCAPPPCLLCSPSSLLVWLPRSLCLCCSSPCLLAPAAQMGSLRNRSGSPPGADQP